MAGQPCLQFSTQILASFFSFLEITTQSMNEFKKLFLGYKDRQEWKKNYFFIQMTFLPPDIFDPWGLKNWPNNDRNRKVTIITKKLVLSCPSTIQKEFLKSFHICTYTTAATIFSRLLGGKIRPYSPTIFKVL